MSEHTATPWQSHPFNTPLIVANYEEGEAEAFYNIVATTRDSEQNADANAAFIVRAVNAHDALVEALEIISSNADQAANGGLKVPGKSQSMRDTKEVLRRIRDKAYAALKLAEGESPITTRGNQQRDLIEYDV